MNDQDFSELLKDQDILMAAWTLPNEGTLSDAQRREAMENFRDYIRRHGLTYPDVARQVDHPRATCINELAQFIWRSDSDKHIRTLNNWVEQHARQEAAKLDGTFVLTGVADRIQRVVKMIREDKTMGLLVGPTGIGKSRCAQVLQEKYVGSLLVTIMDGRTTPRGLTGALADALGVPRRAGPKEHRHGTLLDRIIRRLHSSNRLIIVDEAHFLTDDAVNLLRQLHDATSCPIACFATKDMQERVERNADPDHGQVYSRFTIIVPVTRGLDVHAGGKPCFSLDEIRKLYEQVPIRLAKDAADYLQDVANLLGRGSLRLCRGLVMRAARRARHRNGLEQEDPVTITADDLAYAEERLRPQMLERGLLETRRAAKTSVAV